MCEYRLPFTANIEPLCGISLAPLAQISIYILSPHPPSPRRQSPFSTKLGKAERAKVELYNMCILNFQLSIFNFQLLLEEITMTISVIIPAAGSATRAKLNQNKIFFDLGGITVAEKTVAAFSDTENVTEIIIACAERDEEKLKELFSGNPLVKFVRGGDTRTASVKNALNEASGDITLIHDCARPFVTRNLIYNIVEAVKAHGAAVPVLPFTDTLGFGNEEYITETKREKLFKVQTPQGFKTELLKKAYAAIFPADSFTDDAGVFCKYIGKVKAVIGERTNKKLTYEEDFKPKILVGTGFDLHTLVEGRKLILGGIEIPHTKGLLGHSDADVLAHAVMDAMLSALSLRDIGYHFPDTDERYKGADSMKLLSIVLEMVKARGYKVNNLSACIMAQKPKLMKFVPLITQNLAAALGVSPSLVGITCTTLEGIGVVGREEGIAVQAYVSLKLAE